MSQKAQKPDAPITRPLVSRAKFGEHAGCESCPYALACMADEVPHTLVRRKMAATDNDEVYRLNCVDDGQIDLYNLSYAFQEGKGWVVPGSFTSFKIGQGSPTPPQAPAQPPAGSFTTFKIVQNSNTTAPVPWPAPQSPHGFSSPNYFQAPPHAGSGFWISTYIRYK